MTITIKYFASLREQLGVDQEQIDNDNVSTVRDLLQASQTAGELPENTLVAINQQYADFDAPITSGDEVAFFPPVTGG